MKSSARVVFARARRSGQRGVALFFALICMVAIMLAAVMLVRSVDTATLIAGNLAFQQSATRSGDGRHRGRDRLAHDDADGFFDHQRAQRPYAPLQQ